MSENKKKLIDEVFVTILEQLKNDGRALVLLDSEVKNEIQQSWPSALENKRLGDLKKILCLLDHSEELLPEFSELLITLLTHIQDEEILVLTLGTCSRQILTLAERRGERAPESFNQALEKLLTTPLAPEVFEWILRLLEQYGVSSIRFREKVLPHRPGFKKWFNRHHRHSEDLLDLLERRWSPFVSPKKP